jgi:two-component system response regulator YesN
MYTLLVVDDEKWVRQGLKLTVDWEKEGIQLLGEAENGDEACRWIEFSEAPDIIITDIKMPGMDGLALMERVRQRNLNTKVIVISGYSDFSYAQKALRCGAYDYVLKPIQETQLLEVIGKCVRELDKEKKNKMDIEKMSGCIRESLPMARQSYLESSLMGNSKYVLGDQRPKWRALNLDINPLCVSVVAVKVYDWGRKAIDDTHLSAIRYAMGNIAEEIGAKRGIRWIACPLNSHPDADIAVLYSPLSTSDGLESPDKIKQALEEFMDAVSVFLDIRIHIGVSTPYAWSRLPHTFNDALHACAYAFFNGCGEIYDAGSLPALVPSMQEWEAPNNTWETKVQHAVKLGDEEALQTLVNELCRHLKASLSKQSPLYILRGLHTLLDNLDIRIQLSDYSQLAERLNHAFIEKSRETRSLGSKKRIIELALGYIEEHYTEPITMNEVAESHYVNPSYFSKVFHEEVGQTFSKYVAHLRIARAKHLLKHSMLKIYEIAERIGYNDFRHFVKIFKEVEGITPAQYRQLGQ